MLHQLITPHDALLDSYFRAWEVRGDVTLPVASFAVVVVTGGAGSLLTGSDPMPIARGDTLVVPASAGPLTFTGNVEAIVCLPPELP